MSDQSVGMNELGGRGTATDGTKYIINCRECDFWSIEPDMQNADRVRDGHELEMFNWRDDSEPCGPCVVAPMRRVNYE